MLYLDSSALVKCYLRENGSDAVIARATDPSEELFTSVLTFAEVESAIARKHREKGITHEELSELRKIFERDWAILVNVVELDLQSMAALPRLVEQFPLKAADAIQLSTAIWLNGNIRSNAYQREIEPLVFGVADRDLADIAEKCGLRVFNPEVQI